MDNMNPSDGTMGSGSSSSAGMMMVPYLHFAGGDNLFFDKWAPTSAGALAGACVGLVAISLFERWLHAMRSMLVRHWHERALALSAGYNVGQSISTTESEKASSVPSSEDVIEQVNRMAKQQVIPSPRTIVHPHLRRTVAPFIATYDISRGILYALQMLLMYLLMLAVMTFQASYLISIVLGLGIGEILFGRSGRLSAIH